ncbi:DUF262 domain-containing protein [Microbacterium sp. NIBRBAC000506063]|uniref:DUF262 domain-containing protein n=1 Tax=Microbacterium sp. NIBRBAC000506063 TaxID=2734618 RepID=UPI001BB59A7E|nr:DUF262 domain-containing protein [Microbacterium sp. NIBRBAC000506063]QTV78984.1 DUF262 domain-containing protein [Microbacterium sp. NIBRBAC000506063]
MDAKTYPLQEILKPERRYVIPTFQRDYEWTRKGQWELLFDDLATTADRLIEVRTSGAEGSTLKSKEQSISPHFLGAIVCASLPFATGGVALRSVIDGQQRLTTIQLMIRGLLDVLNESGSERTKSVRRMLFNPDDVVESSEEIFKLWPRRKDREVWPSAMGDESSVTQTDHLYMEARHFFADAAREYALEGDEIDLGRLAALADAVSSLFKLVVIDLDDNDDAQVIFEVLNGRQTPLSAIDLVKNLLFLRAELDEEDVEKLYNDYWAQFDDKWWKETIGRGHAARGRRDVLLSVWLTAATGEEANVGHLYREARTYLNDGPDTQDALEELDAFAQAYQTVYEKLPAPDKRLTVAYRRLRALDITTAVPLLTWLATLAEEELSLEDHVHAVQAIESWALRRALVGWQTRGYGALLAKILKDAKAALRSGGNIVGTVRGALRDNALTWPTDDDVRRAFDGRQFYNGMAQSRIRVLLGSIDQQLRSENPHEPEAIVEYDALQIEHVMPRSWVAHWPIFDEKTHPVAADDSDPDWVVRRDERDAIVDRIGNLTLVTGTFNNDVSNLGWDIKRPEFQKQRSLVINYDIAASESWGEDSIAQRASIFADVAIRIWGSPPIAREPD